MLWIGTPLLVLGLMMMTRGWIYTVWPEGNIAERRKRQNLKRGMTTDMKLFGRKVRRVGLLAALLGGALVGVKLTQMRDTQHHDLDEAAAHEAR